MYVTGSSFGGRTDADYATVAYRGATGQRIWVRRYNGADRIDQPAAVAAGPSGQTVFVTGFSYGRRTGADYATVAYRAATGAPLWARRYNGPANGFDRAFALAVSPDGRTVYVTGNSAGKGTGRDVTTVAYRAATGVRLWLKRYSGPGRGFDGARAIAVSPGGGRVYVTGTSAWPRRQPGLRHDRLPQLTARLRLDRRPRLGRQHRGDHAGNQCLPLTRVRVRPASRRTRR